jgi:NodT family efflux transporter outer membrane factor (OMF) lipoprotein
VIALRSTLMMVVATALVGCANGPAYQKPALAMPLAWKPEAPWRQATPGDAAPRSAWWRRFGDTELDALEQNAASNSPTVELAAARLAQARSALAAARGATLPQVGLGERVSRQQISANRPLSNYASQNFATVQNELSLAMTVNYEVDLGGRVQKTIAGATASAEQLAADLENTRLVLSADIATNYFNLRAIDNELRVLGRSIVLQRRALEFVNARYQLGVATGLDLAQQQALLETTQVQLELMRRQRALFEHVIGTLAGIPAAQFALPALEREWKTPAIPLGVPSDLLERRPDIAAAERAMAVANAQIGVATAAYYPSITLGSTAGYDSRELAMLFEAPSILWSIGLSAAQTLFDGGRMSANVEVAQAGYAATVAIYRRTVLVAMQEVQDGITGLTVLARAGDQAGTAVRAARNVLDMTTARYEGGASAYFDVITAQQSLLAAERQAAQVNGQQMVTTVFLIKALGGDW